MRFIALSTLIAFGAHATAADPTVDPSSGEQNPDSETSDDQSSNAMGSDVLSTDPNAEATVEESAPTDSETPVEYSPSPDETVYLTDSGAAVDETWNIDAPIEDTTYTDAPSADSQAPYDESTYYDWPVYAYDAPSPAYHPPESNSAPVTVVSISEINISGSVFSDIVLGTSGNITNGNVSEQSIIDAIQSALEGLGYQEPSDHTDGGADYPIDQPNDENVYDDGNVWPTDETAIEEPAASDESWNDEFVPTDDFIPSDESVTDGSSPTDGITTDGSAPADGSSTDGGADSHDESTNVEPIAV